MLKFEFGYDKKEGLIPDFVLSAQSFFLFYVICVNYL